jgi:hypothetical protein
MFLSSILLINLANSCSPNLFFNNNNGVSAVIDLSLVNLINVFI